MKFDPVAALLAEAGAFLRGLALPFAAPWPSGAPRTPAPHALPVLRFLADCAADSPLLAALHGAAPHLAWGQTYAAAEVGAAFLDCYGWTELAGLRGPLPSAELAAGFLLLGPQTHYPQHSHAAEEVYMPLSGAAAWQRGTEGWRQRVPGELVYHAPHQPHAMRTAAAPLLAFYVWRGGDLTEKSRFGR